MHGWRRAGTEGLNCPHLLLISALAALPSGSPGGSTGTPGKLLLGSRTRTGFMDMPPRQSPRAWCLEGPCAYFSCCALTVLKFSIPLEPGALHFHFAFINIPLCLRIRLQVLPQTPIPRRWPSCPCCLSAVSGLPYPWGRSGPQGRSCHVLSISHRLGCVRGLEKLQWPRL